MSDKVELPNNHPSPAEPAQVHPNPSARVWRQRRIRKHARDSDAYALFNLLTGPELFDEVESLLPQHREQLFPPTETLSMFLAQALSADRSCQKAVNDTAIRRLAASLPFCIRIRGLIVVRENGEYLLFETSLIYSKTEPKRHVDDRDVLVSDIIISAL